MVPTLFFYQLVLIALVWLFFMRVNLDLWYAGPPTKGGHGHGHVTVRRSADPPDRGARVDQSHGGRVSAVSPAL
jgi:hypothetical protein